MFDREALNELFDYTSFTWEAYGRSITALPPDALSRAVSGSEWPALRNVLFHLAAAWDGGMKEALHLDDPLDATPESVATWSDLQAHREKMRGWLRRIIDETPDDELYAPTRPMWPGTPAEMQTRIADIVAHVLLHERGHHGDVTTLLSQLGATPPALDYLVYAFFKQRRRNV
jgi:uncharacterized damage-inducible protein DinB